MRGAGGTAVTSMLRARALRSRCAARQLRRAAGSYRGHWSWRASVLRGWWLAGVGDHCGADRGVGGFVDEDQAAGGPVPGVGITEDGLGQAEPDPADLVQAELG